KDTWRSTDNGATWTQLPDAGWSARGYHSSVVMPDGSIVLTGGGIGAGSYTKDTWRSTDNGATWTKLPDAGWSARGYHSSVVMPDGSIVLMGGYDGISGSKNDVWRVSPAGSLLKSPAHTYTAPGIYQVALQAFNTGGYTSMRRASYVSVTPPTGSPIVSFTGTPATGTAPLYVIFNDTSDVVTPLMWNWSFGDASISWYNTTTSAAKNASFGYSTAGTYTVSLTVTNASGSYAATRTGYITVTVPVVPVPGSPGTPASGSSTSGSDSQPVSSGMVTVPGILKGSTGTFAFSPVISGSSPVGISRVQIITSSDVGEITVIALPVLPGAFLNPPDPPVAGSEQVKAIGINPAAIDHAVITFGVDGSWLTTNHLTSGDIVVIQDTNGQWTGLPTTFDLQDGNIYYFDATVHGFGVFAVAGRKNTGTAPAASIVPVVSIVTVSSVVPVIAAPPVVPAAPVAAPQPAAIQNPPASILTHRPVLPSSPYIPSRFAPIAAVIVGIFVCVISSLIRESEFFNRSSEKVTTFGKKFLQGEAAGLMSSTEISKRGVRPRENLTPVFLGLSWREILVTGITALGFTVAFILQAQLEIQLATLIIFLCTGALASILHDLAHKHVAYRFGSITEYQFWGLGTVTMLATAWFFGNAFGKPSRTVIRSIGEPTPEEGALIRLAGPLMSMAIALASLLLIPLGGFFAIAGSIGFSMNLLNCVFSLVPVKPNDGVEVFAWNKKAWAAIFIPLIAFYLYIYLQ
ncbi:MAG: PKD domain-containing protein, partial [Methanoregulaceae archaeon]